MKKIFLVLLVCIGLWCVPLVVDSQPVPYLVKVKEPVVSLLSGNTGLMQISDTLYRVDSQQDIDQIIPTDNIEMVFPDLELELFDLHYPDVTSDPEIENQWYLNAVGAVAARRAGVSGQGVKIAIIDSGITYDHPDLQSANILQGYNCVSGAEDPNDCSDKVGHGTMVSGLIVAQSDNENGICGLAPNAQIIPIKITEQSTLPYSALFAGLEQALKTDCDIINMSLGGPVSDQNALSVMSDYICRAEELGIIVVAAVGNSGHTDNVMNYPAGFDNVIGVGSVDEDLSSSYFSQKNESVFVSAPGNNIISLFKNNSTATGLGTSLSAPIVTAVIAIIKEVRPECTLQEIKELLKNTSVDYGSEGYDINYGYGVINTENIVEELSGDIPDFIISQGIINSKKRIHIHNNSSDTVIANVFFASYGDNNRLKDIKMTEDVNVIDGVTNIVNEEYYENFFLWDKNLRPYTKKYYIK